MDAPDEKEFHEWLGNYRLKKVPAPLLKDYVGEVRRKIEMPEGPRFPAGVFAGAAVLAVLLAGALMILRPQAPVSDEVLARELFILEMLGEDEGLLSDAVRFEPDAEFLAPGGAI